MYCWGKKVHYNIAQPMGKCLSELVQCG